MLFYKQKGGTKPPLLIAENDFETNILPFVASSSIAHYTGTPVSGRTNILELTGTSTSIFQYFLAVLNTNNYPGCRMQISFDFYIPDIPENANTLHIGGTFGQTNVGIVAVTKDVWTTYDNIKNSTQANINGIGAPYLFGIYATVSSGNTTGIKIYIDNFKVENLSYAIPDLNSLGVDIFGNALPTGYGGRFFDFAESLEWKATPVTETYGDLPPPVVGVTEYGAEFVTNPNAKSDIISIPAGAGASLDAEILKYLAAIQADSLPKIIKRA
jgi:hypothetical protein